jgi:glycosyltransferase involved in cell wall biosynthesis
MVRDGRQMNTISIAMATYNGEQFLLEQLESLARQDFPVSELVVTDDGSTDGTLALIEAFSKTAPFPIRVTKNSSRLGYRANFMKAAGLCTSTLIAFCDQDDVWYPNKLSAAVKHFDDENVSLVHHNATVIDDRDVQIAVLNQPGQFKTLLQPMSCDPWIVSSGFTQIFRRRLTIFSDLWPMSIDPINPGNPMAHDQWFFFLAATFSQIGYIDTPLADYRQHQANTFGWSTPYNLITKIPLWFEDRSGAYANCSLAAKRWTSILDAAAPRLDSSWKEHANNARHLYRFLSVIYGLREELYNEKSIFERWKKFQALIRGNAYNTSGYYTFSRKGMIKDLILAVILGPILKTRGFPSTGGDPTCRIVMRS